MIFIDHVLTRNRDFCSVVYVIMGILTSLMHVG